MARARVARHFASLPAPGCACEFVRSDTEMPTGSMNADCMTGGKKMWGHTSCSPDCQSGAPEPQASVRSIECCGEMNVAAAITARKIKECRRTGLGDAGGLQPSISACVLFMGILECARASMGVSMGTSMGISLPDSFRAQRASHLTGSTTKLKDGVPLFTVQNVAPEPHVYPDRREFSGEDAQMVYGWDPAVSGTQGLQSDYEYFFGAGTSTSADEVPGVRPFSPEPEEEQATFCPRPQMQEAQYSMAPGARLPPSSEWNGPQVPEWNSLAHMKLLNELDGQMPKELNHRQPDGQAAHPQERTAWHDRVASHQEYSTMGLLEPGEAFGSQPDDSNDQMKPFGAPPGYGHRQDDDSHGNAHMTSPMHFAHAELSAVQTAGAQMEYDATLVERVSSVVGYARLDEQEQHTEQLLLRWNEADKQCDDKKVSPLQRVDANVRDFVSRARFAAGQGDNGGASTSTSTSACARTSTSSRGEICRERVVSEHRGYTALDESMQGAWEGADWTKSQESPGSPVSSWLQDPCGYWVHEAGVGCDEAPGDFYLGPAARMKQEPSRPQLPRLPLHRDGSMCDLWSTVEGDDGESSYNEELEKIAAGYHGQSQEERMLGLPAGGDGAGKTKDWCDQFVPRPLQLEFARELRWFAWQGHESTGDCRAGGEGDSKALEGCSRAQNKSPNRRKLAKEQMPPFSLSLPLSLTFSPSMPSLPTSLRLRASAGADEALEGGGEEMQDSDDDMDASSPERLIEERQEGAGHLSRRSSFLAKRVSRKDISRSVSSAASLTGHAAGSPTIAVRRSMSSASALARYRHAGNPCDQTSFLATCVGDSDVGTGCAAEDGEAGNRHESEKFEVLAVSVVRDSLGSKRLDGVDGVGCRAESPGGGRAGGEAGSDWNNSVQQQTGSSAGATQLDQVQIAKVREMLREMHRQFMSPPSPLLGMGGTDAEPRPGCQDAQHPWVGSSDLVMWRLVMYDAMMHAQSLVAAAGHATVKDGIAILDRMAAAGVAPTLHTYNKFLAVIAGAASHGRGNGTHAADAFIRMSNAGIAPDRETYWAWLSVLGSAVYHGEATMQEVYWALQNINQPASPEPGVERAAMAGRGVGGSAVDGLGSIGQEDMRCLQLCLRAAVGGAQRGVAGKADVEWVLRRMRSLQLEADHDTWVLAMQVLVNAAQRGGASVADAERLLDQAEAAGYVASPSLHCAFFQAAAAAAAKGYKHKYALDARERVLARLERLERFCSAAGAQHSRQSSLVSLTRAVRTFLEKDFAASPPTLSSSAAGAAVGRVRGGTTGGGKTAIMPPTSRRANGARGGGVPGAKTRKKSIPYARPRRVDNV